MVTLSGGLRVKKALIDRINCTNYKRYVAEILVIVFGRKMLVTHSLNGRKASNGTDPTVEEALPAETVEQLIGMSSSLFL